MLSPLQGFVILVPVGPGFAWWVVLVATLAAIVMWLFNMARRSTKVWWWVVAAFAVVTLLMVEAPTALWAMHFPEHCSRMSEGETYQNYDGLSEASDGLFGVRCTYWLGKDRIVVKETLLGQGAYIYGFGNLMLFGGVYLAFLTLRTFIRWRSPKSVPSG